MADEGTMPKHTLGWQDEGMANVVLCGTTRVDDLFLTAPNGPMSHGDGEDAHRKRCPVCGNDLILRWSVRVSAHKPLSTEA